METSSLFSEQTNSIYIPAGVFQDNVFNALLPNYFNYGALGAVIARELSHVYDRTGAMYDGEGKNNGPNYRLPSFVLFSVILLCCRYRYNN